MTSKHAFLHEGLSRCIQHGGVRCGVSAYILLYVCILVKGANCLLQREGIVCSHCAGCTNWEFAFSQCNKNITFDLFIYSPKILSSHHSFQQQCRQQRLPSSFYYKCVKSSAKCCSTIEAQTVLKRTYGLVLLLSRVTSCFLSPQTKR